MASFGEEPRSTSTIMRADAFANFCREAEEEDGEEGGIQEAHGVGNHTDDVVEFDDAKF